LVIASCCDIVLASEDAFFSLPEVSVGLYGGARHAMRLMGQSRARRLALSASRLPAAELYRTGNIERCCPGPELLSQTRAIATEIARHDPEVVQRTKRALNLVEEMPLHSGYAYEQSLTFDRLALQYPEPMA
jgi:enoyl-CoA hydratase/carnithine racemase